MKVKKLWIVLLVLCLVGCGSQQDIMRETSLPPETTQVPTVPSETEGITTEPVPAFALLNNNLSVLYA